MSQAQPLSTLAPEYSNQLQPSQQYIPPQMQQSQLVANPQQQIYSNPSQNMVEHPCPPKKKPCPPKEKPCPPKENPCPPKENPCPPKEKPCPTKDKCADPCSTGYGMVYGWGWLGALILWFIIFTVLFWLIFYSLKPSFVLQNDSNQVDTSKVLLAAVIAALILVIIIWLIKLAVTRRYY